MGTARNLANFKPSSAGLAGVEDLESSATQLFGSRNKIINGAMLIDQRNNGSAVTLNAVTGDTYTLDRWQIRNSVDAAMLVQQVSDAPTGFTRSLRVTMSGSDTSIGSTQYAQIRQHIEGLNFVDMSFGASAALPFVLGFWVKVSITGTYTISLANSNNTRVYATAYTVNSSNTWEYKSIVVPGDTAGTWRVDNDIAIRVAFTLAAGSSFTGSANTWGSAEAMAVSGQVNFTGTNGATFQVTGVQLEKGSVATPFEHRPYGTELALCKRYFQYMPAMQGNFIVGGGNTFLAGAADISMNMRATPTGTLISGTDAIHVSNVANYSISSINDINNNYFRFNTTSGAGSGAPGHFNIGFATLSAEL